MIGDNILKRFAKLPFIIKFVTYFIIITFVFFIYCLLDNDLELFKKWSWWVVIFIVSFLLTYKHHVLNRGILMMKINKG